MSADMNQMSGRAKRLAARLTEWVWPARSIVSGQRGVGLGAAAPAEWAALSFIEGAQCDLCGLPQPIDLGPATVCPACTARPPRWNRARAALIYDDASRRPVLDLKRAGRRDGLSIMGAWMMRAGRPLLSEADLITPVPLHYTRLAMRGHNQSGWLAAAVSRASGVPAKMDVLRRIRATPSQAGLPARARRRNVAGAFDVRGARVKAVSGQRIVLVDDVLTTGATPTACTRALYKAGAANVDVLVLARVVRAQDVTI